MSLNFSAKEIYGDRNTGERKEYPLIHNAESLLKFRYPLIQIQMSDSKSICFLLFLSRRAVQYPEEAK